MRPERGLSASAARVFYNLADAWLPAAGDVDLVPALERLVTPAEQRALERGLRLLEWEPRLRLWSLRGFAWLPRERRRELLALWARSPWPARRRWVVRTRALLEAAWRARDQSRAGA